MKYYTKIAKIFMSFLSISVVGNAYAQEQLQIVQSPSTWRLQNYSGSSVVIWNVQTITGCSAGLGSARLNENDKDRLWSLILTAKSTNKNVGIYYIRDGGTCQVESFYIEN